MPSSSNISTHTVFTGAGVLGGSNAGSVLNGSDGHSIIKDTSIAEQSVSKSVTQSKSSVDTTVNTGHTEVKAQFSKGQKAAIAAISRALRRRR